MTNRTDIIRVYVGEIIKDKSGIKWLIYDLEDNGNYHFMNLHTGYPEVLNWPTFKLRYYPIERLGKLNGIELLEGEDWLCHDGRCYPGVLAGGCSGCIFSGLTKERKRYFEPGDIVWVPSEKTKRRVIETTLFYNRAGTPNMFYSLAGLSAIFYELKWSVRFRLEKYPVSNQFYRWDEIRLVKRKRHFINYQQLSHVCNDLCLFGPYSKTKGKTCWDCETGKIWRLVI